MLIDEAVCGVVCGVVAKRYDLPVFVPRKGEPVVQGIPVPEGTDLHEAGKRYIIEKPVWRPVKE